MHESFVWFRSCVLANPQSSISLLDEVLGFCAVDVLKGMPINDFSFVGTHFKTHLGIQRDGSSFGPGSSNRGGERPVGWGIQRGRRSLGSGFQRRQRCLGGRNPKEGRAFRGRKNPKKPAVSWHTTLPTKSSVLYLWRPWVAERGCSGREQALSVSHRTGGFWRATR